MKIHLQYFAALREQRGLNQESLQTESVTAGDLYEELKARHKFSLDQSSLRVAINDEFREWDVPLKSEDQVVFIPPVAGG